MNPRHTQRAIRLNSVVGLVIAVCTGCGEGDGNRAQASTGGASATIPSGTGGSDSTVATGTMGLQYEGSIVFAKRAATEPVELSGPILPDLNVLYAAQGAAFPTTLAQEELLANQAALTFASLITECAPLYPGITLQKPGDPPLTQAQRNGNYELIAQCAYDGHSAKPYWIPKLVDDVDVCGSALGVGWRLISESDIASFTDTNFQYFSDTLAGASNGAAWSSASYYFSLHVYVRGNDGTLKEGYLNPGALPRVAINSLANSVDMKLHYESDVALRCIR